MTANKRIALNVIATYGRSLYQIALGLFTARWALSALGNVDFGLFGLVGGLIGFVTFLNTLLAVSTSRFFAYNVGSQLIAGNEKAGLLECQKWFTIAVLIHFFLGCVLVLIGYPIGACCVQKFLVIPSDRMAACLVVWRATCTMAFFGMVNVPFQAMFTAKQEIAEMTLYSLITTTGNAIFLYYAASHPGDWLGRYAISVAAFSVLPMVLVCARAIAVFPECRFLRLRVADYSRVRLMVGYSSSQFLADFAGIVGAQGVSIVVNRFLGPAFNAAMSIGNNVADKAATLGMAMVGAFHPAIVNAAGAHDYERMRALSYQSCKFSCAVVLFFAIPLILEVDEVMVLWLMSPPKGAAILCSFALASFIVNRSTSGLSSAIEALGRIAAFKFIMAIAGSLPFLLALLLLSCGFGIIAVGFAGLVTVICFSLIRVYYAQKLAGVSVSHWIRKVLIPVAIMSICSVVIAFLPRYILSASVVRIVITTVLAWIVLAPLVWIMLFDAADKDFILTRIRRCCG